jgi:hypothetical protein
MKDINQSPDIQIIEIDGNEYKFLITPFGMIKADELGIDILKEFSFFQQEMSKGAEASPTKAFAIISKILWCGLLPFNQNLKLEDVQNSVTITEMLSLAPMLAQNMARVMGNGQGEAQAPTKARGKK